MDMTQNSMMGVAQHMVLLVLPGQAVAFLQDQTIPEFVNKLGLS